MRGDHASRPAIQPDGPQGAVRLDGFSRRRRLLAALGGAAVAAAAFVAACTAPAADQAQATLAAPDDGQQTASATAATAVSEPTATAVASSASGDGGLGRFALIPEAERKASPDFELVRTSGEPFGIAAQSGRVVVMYQTEF